MKVAIYTVDSQLMSIQDQEDHLRNHAKNAGLEIVMSFSDVRIWNRSVKSLNGLNAMMKAAAESKFKKLLIADISFLGLSLQHLLAIIQLLELLNIKVEFINQGLGTYGTKGKAFLHILESLRHFDELQVMDRVHSMTKVTDIDLQEVPAVFRKNLKPS